MSDDDDPKPELVDAARRRLLGLVGYVPPMIIASIALEQAGCQPVGSCVPNGGCNPTGCVPDNCPPAVGCPPVTGCRPAQ